MANTTNRIREQVEVRPHPTVVRLADLEGDKATWLTESFVLTPEIKTHLQALRAWLTRDRGGGAFLIGHYGAGKSHFLAYLSQQLRAHQLVAHPPEVNPVSLLNFSAANRLEDILSEALAIRVLAGNRRPAFEAMLAERSGGLLLIIDELSEFLRSKADARAFNEDVRFLQFIAEWAQDKRFWILAAMQEGIEHTGELEYSLYRKIKDRYPLRLLLSPAHVHSLIADSILVKKPGYRAAVVGLVTDLRAALPDLPVDYLKLASVYPVHPATLELLEEVRDRFSQARGVVDFVVTRLRGDPTRGLVPFLDEPWGRLVTPETIVDHFRDLFELQPEFLPIAQQVFPWYQRHFGELFERPALADLAERLLKLLVLVHISPSREALTPVEATAWLLFSATRVDPERNVRLVEQVLDRLASGGRYVSAERGSYRLNLKDEGAAAMEEWLHREMRELRGQHELVLEALVPLLPEGGFNPFRLPREQWQHRRVVWHFHERRYAVWLGEGTPAPVEGLALCLRLPWGEAGPASGLHTLIPGRLQVGEDFLELAALARLRERPLAPEVLRRLEQRLKARSASLENAIRNAWLEANLITPEGRSEIPPRLEEKTSLEGWLGSLALWLLRRTYPAFERFKPGQGPLPKEAWLRFMRTALEEDPDRHEADEYAKLIREAYLVPMGLLRRKGGDYVVAPSLEQHELVRLLAPLFGHEPSPRLVHEHLANPIYGLVPDQANALLIFLLLQGEIDILKDRKSYRECFETLPNPLHYDRIVPGHALNPEQLRALMQLGDALGLRPPRQWTVLAQRRSALQLRDLGRARAERLGALVAKITAFDARAALTERLHRHIAAWQALVQGTDPLEGFVQFLFEVGSVTGFLEEMRGFDALADRIPELVRELERYRHLVQHPALSRDPNSALAQGLARLGETPPLDRTEALETWLQKVAALYAAYKNDYQNRHDAWWQGKHDHPLWQWQAPALVQSRHLGLGETLAALDACRADAQRLRCRGLVNLDYQPLCACGFDGESAPIEVALKRFETLCADIDGRLRLFFQQQTVKTHLREWQRQGFEANPETMAYLKGERAFPEVRNVDLLDKYLSGLELVKELDEAIVLDLLHHQRVWEPRALLAALEQQLQGGQRLRFKPSAARATLPEELIDWCAEQALRHGVPLPQGLNREALSHIGESMRLEWVGAQTLLALDTLGLDQRSSDRIVRGLLDGQLSLPEPIPATASALSAVRELLRPSTPGTPENLARLSEALYREHGRFVRLQRARWIDRLNALADSALGPLPDLGAVLRERLDAQWLLLDCVGLPLLHTAEPVIETLFLAWKPPARGFAQVALETTTDGCYRHLIAAGINHAFEKCNAVDTLLHSGFTPFADLAALAATELQLACKALLPRLDPGRGLFIFADHGFRIGADGKTYGHGGGSTLERIVPCWHLASRGDARKEASLPAQSSHRFRSLG